MITAIEVENFKGIRDRVRIDLKPITLLFGPNSSGKSTILHALHYAREIFERGNLNADQTIAGGTFVNLGGFQTFVNGRDQERKVTLRFDLNLANQDLPTYTGPLGIIAKAAHEQWDISSRVQSAAVEVTVAWSELRQTCYVQRYRVDINGEMAAEITCHFERREVAIRKNQLHPVWSIHEIRPSDAGPDWRPDEPDTYTLLDQTDATPNWGKCLHYEIPQYDDDDDAGDPRPGHELIASELSQIVVGPGELLRDYLKSFRYLGPIRETPGREFSTPRSPDPSRWASGMAAWDMLATGSDSLVQQVSDWMSNPDRLNTRYSVERRRYKRLDLADPLALALASGRAFDEADKASVNLNRLPTDVQLVLVQEEKKLDLLPPDVGIGISQILPVVVAAAGSHDRLVVIEQPELHVHPRIQAELGDLFIQTSVGGPHEYLIETHSEHLILRILRRIRETGEGKPNGGVAITGADVAVYYVNVENDRTQVRKIDIDKKGEFLQPWPDDFFEIDFYERFA